MREVLLLLGLGLAVGMPAALALGRFISAQLHGIKANDPWVAGIAVILLSVIAALAGLVPARRASRIDPLHACAPNDFGVMARDGLSPTVRLTRSVSEGSPSRVNAVTQPASPEAPSCRVPLSDQSRIRYRWATAALEWKPCFRRKRQHARPQFSEKCGVPAAQAL
jgi:hypothetical protein